MLQKKEPMIVKGKARVPAQMSIITDKKFNDLTGHKGRSILVNIDPTWVISLGCKGTQGQCSARYDLEVTEGVWMAGIKGTNKFEAQSFPEFWLGHRNQINLPVGTQTFIVCTSECTGSPTGITKTEGSHLQTHLIKKGGGEAFDDITGTVTFKIKPSTAAKNECTTAKEWTMILKIKSSLGKSVKDPKTGIITKGLIIDEPNSDFDGDMFTNMQERNAGTDPLNDGDFPKPP